MIKMKKDGALEAAAEAAMPVEAEYDVVVAGGGMAGFGAAVAAAKAGCKTILIEGGSALGGLATLGLVNIPLDFVSGIGTEMFESLTALNGLWHRNSDPEKHKLVLDRMALKYGAELLLCTQIVEAIVKDGSVKGAVIQTKTGRRAVIGKRFVDATGDSDLAFYAGAETVSGRPEDGMSQACSLEFRLGGVDWEQYMDSGVKREDGKWIKLIKGALKDGSLKAEYDNHLNWLTHVPGRPQRKGMDEVSICFAHSRRCFPINHRDLTRMYLEGREQAEELSRFIKAAVPGFQNSYLVDTAPLLGVRESRRILGECVLRAEDLASLRKFDDVVAISAHGYDVHNFEGPGNIKWAPMEIGGKTEYVICNGMGWGSTTPAPDGRELVNYKGEGAEKAVFDPHGYYDIPYRSLVPARLDNLLAAGRNLSSDIYAQSGARLVMCCLTMGEAAGTASALSLKRGVPPRKLDRTELQAALIQNKVNIGQGFRNIPGLKRENIAEKFANSELGSGATPRERGKSVPSVSSNI